MKRGRKKKKPEKMSPGRKGQFKEEYTEQVFQLALLGATDSQIADFFGVSMFTIDYWKDYRTEFSLALRQGKMEADMKVADALYKRATGITYEERERILNRAGEIIREKKTTKFLPPDVRAAAQWLSLRQRLNWSKSTDINVNYSGEVDVRFLQEKLRDTSQYSIEELKQGLMLGVKKIGEQQKLHSN